MCHVSPEIKTPQNIPDRRETAYETLGVDPFADYPEISSAWRQLSEETHPDRIGHDKFQEYYSIQSAYYNIYIDPRRCAYDQSRGIQGKWADKVKECDEMLLAYTRALAQMDRERAQAREAKAREEDKTFEDDTTEEVCECECACDRETQGIGA